MLVDLELIVTLKLNTMSNKHDANVRKSTLVTFQVGLIASLLFVYGIFEMRTAVRVVDLPVIATTGIVDVGSMPDIQIEKPEAPVVVERKSAQVTRSVDISIIDIIKNGIDTHIDSVVEAGDPNPTAAPSVASIIVAPEEEKDITFPINKVTHAPIFPGCDVSGTNQEKIACFSGKIKKLVSRKFNGGLGAEYGLDGLQQIYVQFDVATDGTIQQVRVRAPHPALEKETRRVVALFPDMIPGRKGTKAVTVRYQLPIVFQIQD